jgi:hypothetical protein
VIRREDATQEILLIEDAENAGTGYISHGCQNCDGSPSLTGSRHVNVAGLAVR